MKFGANCWFPCCCCEEEDLRCLVVDVLVGTFERSGEEGEVRVGRRVIVGELEGLSGVGGPMLMPTLLRCGARTSFTVRTLSSSSANTNSLDLEPALDVVGGAARSRSLPFPPPTTEVTDATKRWRWGEDMLAMAEVARERVPVRCCCGGGGGVDVAEPDVGSGGSSGSAREGKRVARGEGTVGRREVDGEGGGAGEVDDVDEEGPVSGKRKQRCWKGR